MQIVRGTEGRVEQGTTFTGETWLTRLIPAQEPEGTAVSVVRFEDGSRTNWHVHPGEQVLYIIAGEGRVGTETEEFQVFPGDVVYSKRGERHWHGAAEGKSMTHLTVTTVGSPEWFEAPA
ncbi:MAG: cupin domain-containing protein [Chloroflexota bacterium]|nr:cupin domain-containing protein [Chloroflexota bacterium]